MEIQLKIPQNLHTEPHRVIAAICVNRVPRLLTLTLLLLARFLGSTSAFIIEGNDAQRCSAVCVCFINMFQKGAETPADLTFILNETSCHPKHPQYTFIYDHIHGDGTSWLWDWCFQSIVSDIYQVTRLVLQLWSFSLQKHLNISGKTGKSENLKKAGKFECCHGIYNFFICDLWHMWHQFKLSITQKRLPPKFM